MRTRRWAMLEVMISIHVPKTGGTTFLNVLQHLFGDELLLDYRWMGVDLPLGSAAEVRRSLERVRCIHGHFPFGKYAGLRERDAVCARFVTWLRDPVDLVVSAYEYLRSKPLMVGFPLEPWEQAASAGDLLEFARHEFARNRQSKQLRSDTPDAFDFVGITEEFSRSLRLFRAMFFPDRELPMDVEPQRVNPRRRGDGYSLDDARRSAVEDLNAWDTALYQRARQRFAEQCAEYGIGE